MISTKEAIILIPSLHPDEKLGIFIKDLVSHGFIKVVIVDDGSGMAYKHIFDDLSVLLNCEVLSYSINRGKGYALKHGIQHILEKFPDVLGVVTADSDGQHTVEDCCKVFEAMQVEPKKLVLGIRNFYQKGVPVKSKAGNLLTSFFFAMLYNHWLQDTQTGLRGISRELLMKMLDIPGERFEYEMNMLIYCVGWNLDFIRIPISTTYFEENRSTHFRAFRDSARIYKQLFKNFFKFTSASVLSTLLDLFLFTVLVKWLLPALFPAFSIINTYWLVLSATAIARICSALFNYKVNKQFVFRFNYSNGAMQRYAILVILVLFLSATLVTALNQSLGLGKTIAKVIVDVILFFANYHIQRSWVFH